MEKEVIAALIGGAGTILAALIVGVAGGLITRAYARERDRQDKESQWRQHAIELTKLDVEGKIKCRQEEDKTPIRPSVLDFLANYRDLKELDDNTPAQLYQVIIEKRIDKKE